jgi:glycosyltransferase involved in cell wall biosynthesis
VYVARDRSELNGHSRAALEIPHRRMRDLGRPMKGKVAYLVSRFPKLTETFVLYEILAVERAGRTVELYALQRERTSLMHPEARAMLPRVRFAPLFSLAIARSHLHYLRTRPREYLASLGVLMRANLGSARYFFGALGFFPKAVYFAREMERQGVSHVHAHFASHPAAVAYVIGRLTGIPYSFTAHGSDLHRDKHMLREKVGAAHFVVAISQYNRNAIVRHCGDAADGKVVVVHCGVDTDVFQPSIQAPAESSGALRIVCVGTLHAVKGQRYLVDACRVLLDRKVDFQCRLVGEGPDRRALARQIEQAGLGKHVLLDGRVDRDRIRGILAQADVVVAPSVPTPDGRREGIPVALMEAAACGLPVIGTRLTGVPELVRDGEVGLLVEPGDAEGLATALETLARDPQLRVTMGARGRKHVLREFDLDSIARELAGRFGREAVAA